MMPVTAVLFDLDGTLVDSERQSAQALAAVLTRDGGLAVTQTHRDYVIGHSWNEIFALLQADFGAALPWPMDELVALTSTERGRIIRALGLPVLPGAVAAVRRLAAQFSTALVTGSSREEARQSLRVLGLQAHFKVVLASEDYAEGKPAPAPYLGAAHRLGVAPADCVVIEDSAPGIAAGRAAGMRVIAVRAGNFSAQDQSAAHVIVNTLDEISCDLVLHGGLGGTAR